MQARAYRKTERTHRRCRLTLGTLALLRGLFLAFGRLLCGGRPSRGRGGGAGQRLDRLREHVVLEESFPREELVGDDDPLANDRPAVLAHLAQSARAHPHACNLGGRRGRGVGRGNTPQTCRTHSVRRRRAGRGTAPSARTQWRDSTCAACPCRRRWGTSLAFHAAGSRRPHTREDTCPSCRRTPSPAASRSPP